METESRTEAGAGESRRGGGEGAGTRRKLNEEQEREVTRLYAETDTPVSEISKRFGIGESSVYRVAQRHGASLRGRTAPTPAASTGRPAGRPPGRPAGTGGGRGGARGGAAAAATTTGRAAGGTRGRRAAGAAAATPTPTRAPSANGRRRGAGGRGPGRGRRAGAAAGATRATVAARTFRVSFTAVRVFTANSMADAIRQAEAAGATDITGVQRND